jgi:hypothetical protein
MYTDDAHHPDNPDQDSVMFDPEDIAQPTTSGKDPAIIRETSARQYDLNQAPLPDDTTIERDLYGNPDDQIAQPRRFLRSGRTHSSRDLTHPRSILKPTTQEHETPKPVLNELSPSNTSVQDKLPHLTTSVTSSYLGRVPPPVLLGM